MDRKRIYKMFSFVLVNCTFWGFFFRILSRTCFYCYWCWFTLFILFCIIKLQHHSFVHATVYLMQLILLWQKYRICVWNENVLFSQTHSLQDMRQQAAVSAKVFIQRDYTNGTVCQFQTKFPSELETRVGQLFTSSITWLCYLQWGVFFILDDLGAHYPPIYCTHHVGLCI